MPDVVQCTCNNPRARQYEYVSGSETTQPQLWTLCVTTPVPSRLCYVYSLASVPHMIPLPLICAAFHEVSVYPKKELPFFILFTGALCSCTAILALLTHQYPEPMGIVAKTVSAPALAPAPAPAPASCQAADRRRVGVGGGGGL